MGWRFWACMVAIAGASAFLVLAGAAASGQRRAVPIVVGRNIPATAAPVATGGAVPDDAWWAYHSGTGNPAKVVHVHPYVKRDGTLVTDYYRRPVGAGNDEEFGTRPPRRRK